jgi:hypothetical protein
MARYGLPSNDIGHFCHRLLINSHFKDCLSSNIVLSTFLTTYKKSFNPDIEYIKDAAIVLGALLTVWESQIGVEKRDLIKLGIEYMKKASICDYTWLKQSVLKDLISTDNLDPTDTSENIP